MGRGLGGLTRGLVGGLMLVLLAPLVALGPAMVLDRGPDGAARASAFPAALVVLDPLVWRCVRNSVVVAVVVTTGSLALGLALGTIAGRRRFWGRWVLGRLAILPLAIGPIWLTPGVVAWVGGESGWAWLAARSFLGQPGDEWGRWAALAWVGIVSGTPLAILAIAAGLARVDPARADAARVVGATRRRVWLDVTWPTIRPELVRAGVVIFATTLVEPAGPIILGLRRTLAVELAIAARRFAEPNRAATLAAIAIGIALAARWILLRWGGARLGTDPAGFDLAPAPRAGARLGALAVVALGGWTVLSLGPPLTFARGLAEAALGSHPPSWPAVRSILEGWLAPEMMTWVGNSAVAATLAVAVDLVLLAALARMSGRLAAWLAAIPPLTLGVGALALPWLVATGADAAGGPIVASILHTVAVELSPGRSPGFLLVIVLAVTSLPLLARAAGTAGTTPRREPVDAALLTGATTRAARRVASDRTRAVGLRPALVAWTWASTDLAAAWVLTALDERKTLAPAALALIEIGGPIDHRLPGLFALMVAIRLVGLAARAGRGRGGDWLAGG